ncbi:MAG: methylated-DNA--[protein]-cysteine S-methyltransferase [Cytophagaceae bacterium]
MKTYISYYSSPIGLVEISATDNEVISVLFAEEKSRQTGSNPLIDLCKKQLEEYFKGERRDFSLPYLLLGTDFQKEIWNDLKKIEFGKTISYSDMAERLKSPNASRAVGSTNGKNVLLIILPCHRVVGQDGSLTGYAGGLWRKKWLLEHEARVAGTEKQMSLGF